MLLTCSGILGYITVNLFSAFRASNYTYLLYSFTKKKKKKEKLMEAVIRGNTKVYFVFKTRVTLILCMLCKNFSRQQMCDKFSYFPKQNGI